MIKQQNIISQKSKNNPKYRITATLLNSWQRIFDAKDDIRENENDEIAFEDKVEEEQKKRYEEFINVLKRVPTPDNEYMKRGREYGTLVCEGKDEIFSPIIENGAFQVTLTKEVEINNMPILLYGVLDVLKAGKIYDIKRVSYYKSAKYKKSHQHPMYLYLSPTSLDFTYIIMDDKNNRHIEKYERCNCEDIIEVISDFLNWLESRDLLETYKQNWLTYN